MTAVRVVTVLTLVATIILARAPLRTFFNPVTVLAGPFAFAISIQALFLPIFSFGLRSAALICAGPLVLLAGLACASGSTNRRTQPRNLRMGVRPGVGETLVPVVTVASLAIAFGYSFLLYKDIVVRKLGTQRGVFYRQDFFTAAGGSGLFRALQFGMYAAALLFAIDIVSRGFRRPAPITFLVLAVAQAVVTTGRSSTILIVLIMATAWGLCHGADFRRISQRNLAVGAAILILLFAVYSVVNSVRANGRPTESGLVSAAQFLAGPPSALSAEMDGQAQPEVLRGVTIGGLVGVIQHTSRPFGIYANGNYTFQGRVGERGQGYSTNLYTWYFPLIKDLTLPGALALIFALGMVLRPLTGQAFGGTASPGAVGFCTALYLLLVWALNTPLSYYNFWWGLLFLSPLLNLLYTNVREDREVHKRRLLALTSGLR